MSKTILVVLRKPDTADQMMPYLEDVAQPGMRVLFLIHYPMESWPYLKDHLIEADTARAALSAAREVIERHSWDGQKRLAEEKIAHLRPLLQKRQVEVEVDLYTGTLGRIIRKHESDGTIHSIMTQAEGCGWVNGFFARAIASVSGSPRWLSVKVFSPSPYQPQPVETTY